MSFSWSHEKNGRTKRTKAATTTAMKRKSSSHCTSDSSLFHHRSTILERGTTTLRWRTFLSPDRTTCLESASTSFEYRRRIQNLRQHCSRIRPKCLVGTANGLDLVVRIYSFTSKHGTNRFTMQRVNPNAWKHSVSCFRRGCRRTIATTCFQGDRKH